LIGAFWGIGHTLTIFVVGAGIILFNLVIPVRVGLSMELSVAVMLIILGLWNIAGFLRSVPGASVPDHPAEKVVHSHPHSHGDLVHNHPHAHQHESDHAPLDWMDRVFGKVSVYQYLRPLVVGIVHGLAGSAAVALLVLTTIRNPWWALVYLLVFGIGTIVGMMFVTSAIAMPIAYSGKEFAGFRQALVVASGLLSIGFGCFLTYQNGLVNGL